VKLRGLLGPAQTRETPAAQRLQCPGAMKTKTNVRAGAYEVYIQVQGTKQGKG
jgi:hypothetical protein